MSEPYFGRLIPAMITPFKADESLDLPRAQELVDRLIEQGCDSLVICATTGESPTVFYDQKLLLFEAAVEAAAGRAKIIAYTGDNCTADSVEFSKKAEKLGVDGMLLVVPYYNKPPQEGIYRHFKAVAEAVDIPSLLYNIPGRCVTNMTAETTLRLANDVESIIGIKEASGKWDQIAEICDNAPKGFHVYSGDDEVTLKIMDLGGVGVVSTCANVAAPQMRDIIDTYVAGDKPAAYAKLENLLPLMQQLFITTNPIMVKKAAELIGFPCGGLRLPMVEATPEQTASLEAALRQVGII